MGILNTRKLIWFNGIQARMILMLTFVSMLITFIILDGLLFLILFFSIKKIIISPIRAVVVSSSCSTTSCTKMCTSGCGKTIS